MLPTRVGWRFVVLYALAYTGTWIALLTPVLITIALKVRQLTPGEAATNHSLVLSIGAFFALASNPLFGRLSDRTTSRFGMRRPWLIGGVLGGAVALLVVARAETIATVLMGWCLAQLSFNAVLAALVAVLPDQVPTEQRGTVAGVLGTCMPLGQLAGTYVVQAVAGSTLAMFMVPALIGAAAILLLAVTLPDRRLDSTQPVRDTVSWYWVAADADGRFELGGLDDRRYTLRVLDPKTLQSTTSQPVQAGDHDVRIEMPAPALFAKLAGRITTVGDRPVAGVSLQLRTTCFETHTRVRLDGT